MSETPATELIDCHVCVLGAGIAGLNALFAASRHVSASDKLVIVDRSEATAGMWNSTYRYVRFVIVRRLPRWVHAENGLDPLALFPWHRRLFSLLRLVVFSRVHPNQLRDTLDVVRARLPVELGPLSRVLSQAHERHDHNHSLDNVPSHS